MAARSAKRPHPEPRESSRIVQVSVVDIILLPYWSGVKWPNISGYDLLHYDELNETEDRWSGLSVNSDRPCHDPTYEDL